jgi:hypothetical protein
MALGSDGKCHLLLTDLCQPGRLSALSAVACSLEHLSSVLTHGTLQITLHKGYVLMRSKGEVLSLEFRSHDDASPTRVNVSVASMRDRLAELQRTTASASPPISYAASSVAARG